MERHRGGQAGWLRAAVLGADDGIVSTASLMLGVAALRVLVGGGLAMGVTAVVGHLAGSIGL